jgi:hypothetical protein
MSRTSDVNDICIMLFDEPIQMNVDEILSRGSSPVPEQSWFDLFGLERLSQQGILEEIDLADAEIIRRSPVPVHLVEHVWRQGPVGLRRFSRPLAVGGDRSGQRRIKDKFRGL